MAEQDFQSTVALLPSLSKQQLRHVISVIEQHLLQPGEGEDASHDDDAELLYIQSANVLVELGLRCPPWPTFRRMRIYRHLRNHHAAIQDFSSTNFGDLKRVARQRLYRIYAELLADWMECNPRVPTKIGVYFQNLGMIPELVHDAFPGYAQQGWLPLVLNMGTRDHGLGEDDEG